MSGAAAGGNGNSGGITRDVMIGAVPPAAITDWRYIAVSMLAGLVMFYWHGTIDRLRTPVLVFDAAELALFAVAGAGRSTWGGGRHRSALCLGLRLMAMRRRGQLAGRALREAMTTLRGEL